MRMILCALLLASAPVSIAWASEPEATQKSKKDADAKPPEAPFDPVQMMAVLEKLFPAQPDPLPQRLALSRLTVKSMFPDGTYVRLMDGMMDSIMDRIMDL